MSPIHWGTITSDISLNITLWCVVFLVGIPVWNNLAFKSTSISFSKLVIPMQSGTFSAFLHLFPVPRKKKPLQTVPWNAKGKGTYHPGTWPQVCLLPWWQLHHEATNGGNCRLPNSSRPLLSIHWNTEDWRFVTSTRWWVHFRAPIPKRRAQWGNQRSGVTKRWFFSVPIENSSRKKSTVLESTYISLLSH